MAENNSPKASVRVKAKSVMHIDRDDNTPVVHDAPPTARPLNRNHRHTETVTTHNFPKLLPVGNVRLVATWESVVDQSRNGQDERMGRRNRRHREGVRREVQA